MDVETLVARLATAPEDVDLVELLGRAQAGKRLAQLAMLAKKQSAEYFSLLSRVQATAPAALRTLLLEPGIVTAARRDTGPVALTAAVLGSVSASVTIRPDSGMIRLPGLGTISLPEPGADPVVCAVRERDGRPEVTVDAAGGTVTLPADLAVATAEWLPLRRITTGTVAPVTVTVATDGLLGDLYPVPADFRGPDADEWTRAFETGWRLLESERPGHAAAIAAGLRAIVPVPPHPDGNVASCTIEGTFGAVYLSFPPDPETLGVTLVHEFQHGKLSAALDLVELYVDDGAATRYAPWRHDPRPLGALLQGVYAHLGVAQFWDSHREVAAERALRAHVEFSRWRDATWQACHGVLDDAAFTPAGRAFITALAAELDALKARPVPGAASDLADRMAADAVVSWRLRNFDLDPAAALGLVDAWHALRPPSRTALRTLAAPAARPRAVSDIRQRMLHRRLAGTLSPSAHDADALWGLGDYARARKVYCDRIRCDVGDLDAWAGLALSVAADDPARGPLRTAPEVIAGTYRELARTGDRPDPLRLSGWFAAC
ncbi:aKG-HExxH-type peptide beta-hydroxylase [Nocardia stercoris]|uniref:aKG-HExxH-type peptide beta-hydroxylase n=1 Tax=Nocardia stercoris TaxID=2483361 RepID=UPI001319CA04|nr:HEXXH motif-containing putative peptide modification protein [Nocardia stercoris]